VEVHQQNPDSSDIVLGCRVELIGGTVASFTPGQPNNVAATLPDFPSLRINEVVPLNTSGLRDARGEFEPWLELVNTGPYPVSLDGLYLSDDYGNLTRWSFPPGQLLDAGKFLVVILDGEPGEATITEPHSGFRLDAIGGTTWQVALSQDAATTPVIIDYLHGTSDAADAAYGRIPDGDPASNEPLAAPTPGAPNSPITTLQFEDIALGPPPTEYPVFTWTAVAGRRYQVEYKTDLTALNWVSAGQVTANGPVAGFVDQTVAPGTVRFYRVRQL